MAAVQHRATTRTSNTDNSTTKTKSKATSARKSPATKRKRVSAETARAAVALKGLAVEAPAPSIEANEPGQFGRINVMDITPAEERGIFPARVELGEPFEMTAQVFIEGRTKVGATAIVRNPRGKETMRRAMTCVNPGLDRWTVMVKCGEHSDLKPWEDGYAAVKRQLGEWTVTIEGWEDAYVSWLHDARIKVRVMDDVDNALNSGAELLARWAETPDTGLSSFVLSWYVSPHTALCAGRPRSWQIFIRYSRFFDLCGPSLPFAGELWITLPPSYPPHAVDRTFT